MVTLPMNLDSLPSSAGLLIAALIAVSIGAAALRRAARARAHALALESAVEKLRSEIEAATSVAARAARRLKRIEQEYARMTERMGLVETRAQARSFEQAIDSARRGAETGRLSENFGLSRGEADLISRLHGRKKSA